MPWRFNPFTGNLDETDIPAFNGEVTIGSASNPSIFFTGDPNTGIYSPGADQVALSTNGTGRLFVDADGNVGVGRIVTGIPLTAAQDGAGEKHPFIVTNSNIAANNGAGIYFAPSNSVVGASIMCIAESDFSTSADRDGALSFRTRLNGSDLGSSEKLRITSAGLVGIGTSSPGALLSLYAGASAEYFRGGGNGVTTRDLVLSASTGTNAGDTHTINASGSTGQLILSTASSPRVTVDSSGRVGIGTTSPASELHIANAAGNTEIRIGNVQTFDHSRIFTTTDDLTISNQRTASLILRTAATERARIDSSGRLLVGTSSDSGGALLQVNGNRIRVATAKTPTSASDTGTTGEICWDADYIYVCTATNTWKRAALSTW